MATIKANIGSVISDTTITAKIKAKLAADSIANAFKISIETNQGVVTASGTIPDQKAEDKVVDIIKKTDGVSDIINRLTIE